MTVTPVYDPAHALTHLIALTREITDETLQQLKVDAIAHAGDELADLTPEELAQLGVEERTDLLKYNIARHMKDLLGLDYIEIRLLEKSTGKLLPLLSEGMSPLAATRELMARKEGHGVTGFVAATGQSYVCPDTTKDPLYIEGAEDARSSLTVPLIFHGTVVGTLNVESPHPNNFDDRDRQFLEIYARNIAAALNTLELLQAEKESTASASVQAISREVALPLDDIITDATTVLDRYAGHDDDIVARLRHLLYRAREIRSIIHKAWQLDCVPSPGKPRPGLLRLAGTRLLVVDSDETVRRSAHHLLGVPGGSRGDGPRRPRSDRPDAPDAVLRGPGRYPAARPGRLRDLSQAPRGPAPDPGHPHDRVRLRPLALDRQGTPGGFADGALQAVPVRPPDGGRRTSLARCVSRVAVAWACPGRCRAEEYATTFSAGLVHRPRGCRCCRSAGLASSFPPDRRRARRAAAHGGRAP